MNCGNCGKDHSVPGDPLQAALGDESVDVKVFKLEDIFGPRMAGRVQAAPDGEANNGASLEAKVVTLEKGYRAIVETGLNDALVAAEAASLQASQVRRVDALVDRVFKLESPAMAMSNEDVAAEIARLQGRVQTLEAMLEAQGRTLETLDTYLSQSELIEADTTRDDFPAPGEE